MMSDTSEAWQVPAQRTAETSRCCIGVSMLGRPDSPRSLTSSCHNKVPQGSFILQVEWILPPHICPLNRHKFVGRMRSERQKNEGCLGAFYLPSLSCRI
jgi:hypothetical protein